MRPRIAVASRFAFFVKDRFRNGKAMERSSAAPETRYDREAGPAATAPLATRAMAFIAFTLGTLLFVIGTIGIVLPSWLVALATAFHGLLGLALATAVRLLLGAALFVAAPQSRAPLVFRTLGGLIFVAGLLLPFFGVERFDALLD